MPVVLQGIREEEAIAERCLHEGIHTDPYITSGPRNFWKLATRVWWDTRREADRHEVEEMRSENEQLKALVAELTLKNRDLTPAPAGGAGEKAFAAWSRGTAGPWRRRPGSLD